MAEPKPSIEHKAMKAFASNRSMSGMANNAIHAFPSINTVFLLVPSAIPPLSKRKAPLMSEKPDRGHCSDGPLKPISAPIDGRATVRAPDM
jgi:hypothetical protein